MATKILPMVVAVRIGDRVPLVNGGTAIVAGEIAGKVYCRIQPPGGLEGTELKPVFGMELAK